MLTLYLNEFDKRSWYSSKLNTRLYFFLSGPMTSNFQVPKNSFFELSIQNHLVQLIFKRKLII